MNNNRVLISYFVVAGIIMGGIGVLFSGVYLKNAHTIIKKQDNYDSVCTNTYNNVKNSSSIDSPDFKDHDYYVIIFKEYCSKQ
jgi:hypothetical protein